MHVLTSNNMIVDMYSLRTYCFRAEMSENCFTHSSSLITSSYVFMLRAALEIFMWIKWVSIIIIIIIICNSTYLIYKKYINGWCYAKSMKDVGENNIIAVTQGLLGADKDSTRQTRSEKNKWRVLLMLKNAAHVKTVMEIISTYCK